MLTKRTIPRALPVVVMCCLAGVGSHIGGLGATIPGLFPTGVDARGALLPGGAVDPHYKLVRSIDPASPGPSAFVVLEGFPIPPWIANGPTSKWIAPRADQSGGSLEGDYVYRLEFDLTGLDPLSAVISGRWTTDNGGVAIRLNGRSTGISGDGNFGTWSPVFTVRSGFQDGTNSLEFVVNNAPSGVNPTGLRVELGGTADPDLPPGIAPTVVTPPASAVVAWHDDAAFRVEARGSKPLHYQWRFQGTPLPAATAAIVVLQSVTGDHAGLYDVVVSNDAGAVTSSPARLSVSFDAPGLPAREPPGPSSRRTPIAITEIMYHPAPRADGLQLEFVELYNSNPYPEDVSGYRLAGDIDYVFPEGTSLGGRGRLVVAAVPADVSQAYGISSVLGGFTHKLNNGSGRIRLVKKSGGVVLDVAYSDEPPWPAAADGAGHSLVLVRPSYGGADPRAWAASYRSGGSPGQAEPTETAPRDYVQISEILAHTDDPQLDFAELQNVSPFTIDLSGCFLSDDPATNKFRIPDGTRLGPFGFVSFDQLQMGFRLSAAGETLYLLGDDPRRVIDAVRYPGQENGKSWGRSPAGAARWRELKEPTPGRPNAAPNRPDVVISELMFHPISGDARDEYAEVFNRGTKAVDLGGWRFSKGVEFTFPSNTVLNAGTFLVVARDATRLRASHAAVPPERILGDFSGQLSDSGERLVLARPDTLVSTNLAGVITTNQFFIPVSETTYGDGGRWGEWADGGGSSLELADLREDGGLAPHWAASDETAKAAWTTIGTTGVLDLGVPSASQADAVHILLLGAGEALVDNVEVLLNGVNQVSNGSFESGANGWTFSGTHRLSRWEPGAGVGGGGALHLAASGRGDHIVNHVRCRLASGINAGLNVTLRVRVRWLSGHPEVLIRLRGNFLEASGRLNVASASGTPGAPNSRRVANAGPAITDVTHRPVLPRAGQDARVMARVADVDGVLAVGLQYRVDPSNALVTLAMLDDGVGPDDVAGDGVYTGVLPGQADGVMVAFRVLAHDRSTPAATATFPADAPRRECLVRFGEREPGEDFGTYHLWLTQASIDVWSARDKMSNEDLDATLVAGSHRVIYNAGAHYSGSDYTSPGYNSPIGALCGYDLRVPEDDLFLGERHITLDWPIRDTTDQREPLMFWFLDRLGLPNMHRRYVHLFVNGVERGTIYDDVQQPGDDVVSEWFPDDDQGSLWKTDCLYEFDDFGNRSGECVLNSLEVFNTTGGARKTARYRWNWRPRAVGTSANDFTDLFALVDAMNAPASNYVASVEALVDVDHWTRTFAMNDLASYWDGFGNPNAKNTFLYKPQHDRWKLLSWDFDVGLGAFADPPDAALFPGLGDPAMNRFYTVPAFLRRYWRAIEESVQTFFRPEAVTSLLNAKYDALLAAGIGVASPTAPSGYFGLSIPDWIAQRRSFLVSQLGAVATTFSVSAPQLTTTNRSVITITGTAPVAVEDLAVNGTVLPVNWTSVKTWSMVVPLQLGTNTLRFTALDRLGQGITNLAATRTVVSTATPPSPGGVLFNEWMAENSGALLDPADGRADDWFELFNPTEQAADLSGFWLSDDPLQPNRFVIPSGVLVPARGFLLVWADTETTQTSPGLHVSFRLGKAGESLTLRDPSGRLVDQVTFGVQGNNVSEGRWPDGAALPAAVLPRATPGAANARPPAPGIRILDLAWESGTRVVVSWTSAPGYLYRVEASSRLAGDWVVVTGDLAASATVTRQSIQVSQGSNAEFYRVVAQP